MTGGVVFRHQNIAGRWTPKKFCLRRKLAAQEKMKITWGYGSCEETSHQRPPMAANDRQRGPKGPERSCLDVSIACTLPLPSSLSNDQSNDHRQAKKFRLRRTKRPISKTMGVVVGQARSLVTWTRGGGGRRVGAMMTTKIYYHDLKKNHWQP